jgi:valyl-tRNA synthetase
MAIRITNTLTGEKEPFETLEPGKVSMYVCGPTVYDQAHIGHAMSAIVFDIIRRYFQRPAKRALLGVGDDAALLRPDAGLDLAACGRLGSPANQNGG